MNRIYMLNKGLGSELVKIAPHFFFLFEKNAIKTVNLVVFRSASRELMSAENNSHNAVWGLQKGPAVMG